MGKLVVQACGICGQATAFPENHRRSFHPDAPAPEPAQAPQPRVNPLLARVKAHAEPVPEPAPALPAPPAFDSDAVNRVLNGQDRWAVIQGDSFNVLRGVPSESVDALVTDPPAGIAFMGKEWDEDKGGRDQWVAWLADILRECLRTLKPGGHALVWCIPRTSGWTHRALEDAGFEVRDVVTHLFGTGFPKSKNLKGEHEGWGTALKPAAEFWILARKPLQGTVEKNVRQHGTGALNIDACRIDSAEKLVRPAIKRGESVAMHAGLGAGVQVEPAGRWPANLVLSHGEGCGDACAVGCPVAELDAQSGETKSGVERQPRAKGGIWSASEGAPAGPQYGDVGGASRFFYVAKPARKEKEAGLDGFEVKARGMSNGAQLAQERGEDYEAGQDIGLNRVVKAKNFHPTVKPIALMRWLCRLVTPPGGVVLDPFTGSGTTGVGALQEGFRFLGCEREPDYQAIACARLKHWAGSPVASAESFRGEPESAGSVPAPHESQPRADKGATA